MKHQLTIIAAIIISLFLFQNVKAQQMNNDSVLPASNPFASESKLPFQAPPFDKIKDADYKPAFEAGIKQQQKEVQQIADNTAAPTFKNIVEAMEKTGQLLNRVNNAFNCVTGANTN